MKFEASTTIAAPADKIWGILIDTDKWPEWDPHCEKIEGDCEVGKKVKAFTKLAPGKAFPVKVEEMTPSQSMTWSGGMPLGLFKGVRTFKLNDNGDGTVDFELREEFSGLMLKMIGGSIPDMTVPFQDFVQGLKARAESA